MVTLITGAIRSGKTTYVRHHYQGRQGVAGIIAPGHQHNRRYVNLANGQSKALVASQQGNDVVEVGRYRLLQSTIDWANAILTDAATCEDVNTIVVDEVGKLELKGGGHAPVLRQLIDWSNKEGAELVLIVRKSLIDQVWNRWFKY